MLCQTYFRVVHTVALPNKMHKYTIKKALMDLKNRFLLNSCSYFYREKHVNRQEQDFLTFKEGITEQVLLTLLIFRVRFIYLNIS